MASESPRKRLREEVTCPVCLQYFANPVTLPCEHSVCHTCILYSPTSPLCPLCKRDFRTQNMTLNYDLAGFVEINKLLNDREEVGKRDICGRHQEPLKLFCRDEEVLVCTLCEEEHRGHNIVTMEEAAQEYKDRISASLETLKKRKEIMMAIISDSQAESEGLLDQMKTERHRTADKFGDLWPFLKTQENRTLARMKETEEQLQREKVRHLDRLDQPICTLSRLIRKMEETRELPASWFLQDVGSLLKRSEQKVRLKNPRSFRLTLKRKATHFIYSGPVLERAVKNFKDTVASCY